MKRWIIIPLKKTDDGCGWRLLYINTMGTGVDWHRTRSSAAREVRRIERVDKRFNCLRRYFIIQLPEGASPRIHAREWFNKFEEKKCQQFYGEDSAPIQSAVKQQETHMSISVTTPTFVNGVSADSLSIESLIDLIGASQKRVAELNDLGFESKTVSALIAKEEKGIKAAIAVLDARKVD